MIHDSHNKHIGSKKLMKKLNSFLLYFNRHEYKFKTLVDFEEEPQLIKVILNMKNYTNKDKTLT